MEWTLGESVYSESFSQRSDDCYMSSIFRSRALKMGSCMHEWSFLTKHRCVTVESFSWEHPVSVSPSRLSWVLSVQCTLSWGRLGGSTSICKSLLEFSCPFSVMVLPLAVPGGVRSETLFYSWESKLFLFYRGEWGAVGQGTESMICFASQIDFRLVLLQVTGVSLLSTVSAV